MIYGISLFIFYIETILFDLLYFILKIMICLFLNDMSVVKYDILLYLNLCRTLNIDNISYSSLKKIDTTESYGMDIIVRLIVSQDEIEYSRVKEI